MGTHKKTEKTGRLLIIDDNPRNVQLAAIILDHYNYEVEYALDGPSGLDRLEKGGIDLILLDIMMPEMDGFETCEEIKKRPALAEIPIIFLTAKNDRNSMIKAFKVGGDDYIIKPYDAKELVSRVKVHVGFKKSKEHLHEANQKLTQKVNERTKEIQDAYNQLNELNQALTNANQELVKTDQAKHKFLSILGHEIGDALNEAIGMLQILKHRVETKKDAQIIEKIDTSLIKLETFSKSALRITALQSKTTKLHIERFDLNQTIGFCLINLDEKLRHYKIRVRGKHLDEEIYVHGEQHLISGALLALFDFLISHCIKNSQFIIESISDNGKVVLTIDIDDIMLKKYIQEKEPALITDSISSIDFDSLDFVKIIILAHHGKLIFDYNQKEKITCKLVFNEKQYLIPAQLESLTETNN